MIVLCKNTTFQEGSFPGGAVGKNPPANVGDAGDEGSTPGQEDPLEE